MSLSWPYAALLGPKPSEPAYAELMEAADKLCAYLKRLV
jgi:hypothetical protein